MGHRVGTYAVLTTDIAYISIGRQLTRSLLVTSSCQPEKIELLDWESQTLGQNWTWNGACTVQQ
eukprot:1919791-Rhodomonas_salina.1